MIFNQGTRGHNIPANGWAGAPDPHQFLNLEPAHKHSLFNLIITERSINGRTDRRTDRQMEGGTEGKSLL